MYLFHLWLELGPYLHQKWSYFKKKGKIVSNEDLRFFFWGNTSLNSYGFHRLRDLYVISGLYSDIQKDKIRWEWKSHFAWNDPGRNLFGGLTAFEYPDVPRFWPRAVGLRVPGRSCTNARDVQTERNMGRIFVRYSWLTWLSSSKSTAGYLWLPMWA